LTKSELGDEADSGYDVGFQEAAIANRSARVLWNLKEVGRPNHSEALELVLPALRSHMGWILPRIRIKMERIGVQGVPGTVKERDSFLSRSCSAPVGCPLCKLLVWQTLS